MNQTTIKHLRSELFTGLTRAIPIMLGYLTVGFAYGILAQNAGLSLFNGILMSVVVYAGSAQLIGAGMFAMAAHPLSIIATTFIVNLRHMLMSAAISPNLKGWHKTELSIFGFELTDETFALHSTTFSQVHPSKTSLFTSNFVSQCSWIIGTALGMLAGSLIPDIRPLGLDFVLSAMFIALIFMQLKNNRQVAVIFISGLSAMLLKLAGVTHWNVIIATLIAATAGTLIEAAAPKAGES